ncbi:MAG: methyltransferase family protein [Bacteroidales bacterium]
MLNKLTGKENKFLEYALVTGQFSGIILIAVTTHFRALSEAYLIVALLGLALGGYAILVVKFGNFHVLPRPVTNSKMVIRGPYRYIRHPMYTSVILIASALVAGDFSPMKLGIGILLTLCLITKLEYEETLLVKRFPEYDAYRKTTKRLIPFFW